MGWKTCSHHDVFLCPYSSLDDTQLGFNKNKTNVSILQRRKSDIINTKQGYNMYWLLSCELHFSTLHIVNIEFSLSTPAFPLNPHTAYRFIMYIFWMYINKTTFVLMLIISVNSTHQSVKLEAYVTQQERISNQTSQSGTAVFSQLPPQPLKSSQSAARQQQSQYSRCAWRCDDSLMTIFLRY